MRQAERASDSLNVTQPVSSRLGLDTWGLTGFPIPQSLSLPQRSLLGAAKGGCWVG